MQKAKVRFRRPSADEQTDLLGMSVKLLVRPKDIQKCDRMLIEHHYLHSAQLEWVSPGIRNTFIHSLTISAPASSRSEQPGPPLPDYDLLRKPPWAAASHYPAIQS
jgi:hypothetical protein